MKDLKLVIWLAVGVGILELFSTGYRWFNRFVISWDNLKELAGGPFFYYLYWFFFWGIILIIFVIWLWRRQKKYFSPASRAEKTK